MRAALARRLLAAYRFADRMFHPVDRFLNRHTWVLPFVTVAIAVVIFFVNLGTVAEVRDLQSNAHAADIAACQSGNENAVGSRDNYEHDVTNLVDERADLRENRDLVVSLAAERVDAASLIRRKDLRIRHKTEAIEAKRKALRVLIKSRAEFAIAPGSVIKDCAAAYAP